MGVLAYIPTPQIRICFLNRCQVISKKHSREAPEVFIADIHGQIDAIFRSGPSGGTPFIEKIRTSLAQAGNIARYFLGDGVPDGGKSAIKKIEELIKDRPYAEDNPITFYSISDKDADVQWMKELEEVAPFCAEFDDYKAEYEEVIGDQGLAFPFTEGFYLVGSLVAAMNPDDLDAMDESVPFTYSTLTNLLGVKYTNEEYDYYLQEFMNAQARKPGNSPMDQFKKSVNWKQYTQDFKTAPLARDIAVVQKYKADLVNIANGGPITTSSYQQPQAYAHGQGGYYPQAPSGSGYQQGPSHGYSSGSGYPQGPSHGYQGTSHNGQYPGGQVQQPGNVAIGYPVNQGQQQGHAAMSYPVGPSSGQYQGGQPHPPSNTGGLAQKFGNFNPFR